MKSLVTALSKEPRSGRETDKTAVSWISVTAVTLAFLVLIGFGYLQFRNSAIIAEMMNQNKQLLSEIQKMNTKIPSSSTTSIPHPGAGNSSPPDSRTPNKNQSALPAQELPANSSPNGKNPGQNTSISPVSNSPVLPSASRSQ